MYVNNAGPQLIDWRKARRSMGNGNCVEIAPINGEIAVRDSKNSAGPVLQYPASTWRSFVWEARQGDFDCLS